MTEQTTVNQFDSLPDVDGRPVIRCHGCRLVQFKPASPRCVRCLMALQLIPAHKLPNRMLTVTEYTRPERQHLNWQQSIALAVRALRLSSGMSIRDVAREMRTTRTYVSKVENRHVMPCVNQAQRLAVAAGYSLPVLCDLAQAIHDSL